MKKSRTILLLIISLFILAGCESNDTQVSESTSSGNTSSENVVESGKSGHKHCTREGNAGSGTEVSLSYELYYTGNYLNILESVEKVVSADEKTLDTYQDAYQKIHDNYKGLDYYDAGVDRGDTSVTSHIKIDYDRINIDHLLAIEGEEDNIIVNGRARVDKWLELAKKFGTKCEEVQEES